MAKVLHHISYRLSLEPVPRSMGNADAIGDVDGEGKGLVEPRLTFVWTTEVRLDTGVSLIPSMPVLEEKDVRYHCDSLL